MRNLILIIVFNGLSKISILLRELFIAYFCGATILGDIIHISFQLVRTFRRITGENNLTKLVIAQIEKCENKNKGIFVFNTALTSILFSVLIVTILIYLMPKIAHIFPKISESKVYSKIFLELTMVHIFYLIFIILEAIIISLVIHHKKFVYFTIMPIVFNFIVITCGWILHIFFQFHISIGYACVIGGVVQVAISLVVLSNLGYKFNLRKYRIITKDFIMLGRKVIIDIIGSLSSETGSILIYSIISGSVGLISTLSYAKRIWTIPFGIIGNTIHLIFIPKLAKVDDTCNLRKQQELASMLAIIMSLPIVVYLICDSQKITNLIYYYGKFSVHEMEKINTVLIIGTISLPSMMLNKIYTSFFYFRGEVQILSYIRIFSTMTIVIVSYFTIQYLEEKVFIITILIFEYGRLLLMHYFGMKNNIVVFKYQTHYLLQIFLGILAMLLCIFSVGLIAKIFDISELLSSILSFVLGTITYVIVLSISHEKSVRNFITTVQL